MGIRIHFGDGVEKKRIYIIGLLDLSFHAVFISNCYDAKFYFIMNSVKNAGYFVERYPHNITRYKSLEDEGGPVNPEWLAKNLLINKNNFLIYSHNNKDL